MKVNLLNYTPLKTVDIAIGKCWDKQKEFCDIDRIKRVALKNKHSSTIEHLVYAFDIDGISRLCLMELTRHRIASYSVKSTRYTLKELKDEEPFCGTELGFDFHRAEKYIVLVDKYDICKASIEALDNVRYLLKKGYSNDIIKYALPECYKTSLVMTINARSLQNLLQLRTDKSAHFEIRELAKMMFKVLPEKHKFLFEGFVK